MKLTFLWQSQTIYEREWILDIFASVTGEQVFDGKHRIVLDDCLLIDSYINSQPRDYYDQFLGRNAWLLQLSDETYEGGYDVYRNFRGVFRNYWSSIFNPRRVLHLPLGYTNGFTHEAIGPDIERRLYVWSFLGHTGKSSRPEMIEALLPLRPNFVHATEQGRHQHAGKNEYQRILRDSIFVPCSMGNVNLESFRVYEALECGAIPILEKRPGLDYFTRLLGSHPLPTFGNWRQAARFVASIRDDRNALGNLQKQCLAWWTGYKQSLRERIDSFLETTPGDEAGSYIHWRHSLPGWQTAELLRHHTMPAVARRVKLHFERLSKEGKLRKSSGA
jgi:hypothetical protein